MDEDSLEREEQESSDFESESSSVESSAVLWNNLAIFRTSEETQIQTVDDMKTHLYRFYVPVNFDHIRFNGLFLERTFNQSELLLLKEALPIVNREHPWRKVTLPVQGVPAEIIEELMEIIQSSDSLKNLEVTEDTENNGNVDPGFLFRILASFGYNNKSKHYKTFVFDDVQAEVMEDVFVTITDDYLAKTISTFPCSINHVQFEGCSSAFMGFALKFLTERAMIRVGEITFTFFTERNCNVEMALGISRFFRSSLCSVETLTIMGECTQMRDALRGLVDGVGSCRSLRKLQLRKESHGQVNVHLVCEVLRRCQFLKELVLSRFIQRDEDWNKLCNAVCSIHSLVSLSIEGVDVGASCYRPGNGFGKNLRTLVTTSRLQRLAFEHVDMSSVADIEEIFAANKSLRDLDLNLFRMNEAQARAVFSGLQANAFLEGMTLRGLSLEAPTKDALLECLRNGSIKRLSIFGDLDILTANQISSLIGANQTKLEDFRFRESELNDQFFLNLRGSMQLKKLEIYGKLPTAVSSGNGCLKLVSKHLSHLKSVESLLCANLEVRCIESSVAEIAAAMKQNWTLRRFCIEKRYSGDTLSDDALRKLCDIERRTVQNRFYQLVRNGECADVPRLAPFLFESVNRNHSNIFVGLQEVVDVVPFGSVSKKRKSRS